MSSLVHHGFTTNVLNETQVDDNKSEVTMFPWLLVNLDKTFICRDIK